MVLTFSLHNTCNTALPPINLTRETTDPGNKVTTTADKVFSNKEKLPYTCGSDAFSVPLKNNLNKHFSIL